jgi:ABC-type siderophore export system fused ATPase/permease subunit
VTPKGTTPNGAAPAPSTDHHPAASSRYTPPIAPEVQHSPSWVPILMAVLIGLGFLVIMLRYLVWPDTNLPVLFGLILLLGGLYTATKWK